MSNLKILVVDDSPTMREIITKTVKRAGFYEVVGATDGKDALEKLRVEQIDFVITDWNMPEMNGLMFVTTVRNMAEFKELPILMVATRVMKDDIIEALKSGVNDCIMKPFTPEALREKINQVIKG